MTHRLFWLTVGAGLGISGYRRANRLVRGFTRQVAPRPRLQITGLAEFARDVRDGMDLYQEQQRLNIERRRACGGHTLDVHRGSDAEGGRDGSRAPRAHG
ncbi:MAG TPA: hypothetical protein VKS82_15380 [Streptosporangiaceae bacterium]|nr:hypothetical protein [Streptosporangiaceae bacterium]